MGGEHHTEVSASRKVDFSLQVSSLGLAILPWVPLAGVSEQVVRLDVNGDNWRGELSPHTCVVNSV